MLVHFVEELAPESLSLSHDTYSHHIAYIVQNTLPKEYSASIHFRFGHGHKPIHFVSTKCNLVKYVSKSVRLVLVVATRINMMKVQSCAVPGDWREYVAVAENEGRRRCSRYALRWYYSCIALAYFNSFRHFFYRIFCCFFFLLLVLFCSGNAFKNSTEKYVLGWSIQLAAFFQRFFFLSLLFIMRNIPFFYSLRHSSLFVHSFVP